ncbi:MAG: poly-gamma-glutamate biosynthesis protein PgsC [Myxococcales bacterium]|nr:poly-gamma-glutamate biosynthesis protein PgsC [Myxococcales bacterium]
MMSVDMLTLSVGIGLAVSLAFSELFALAAGGMIVPGYLALSLTHPFDVLLTVGTGFVTFGIVHAMSSFVLIYGRRRTVIMILVGYLVGTLVRGTIGTLPSPTGEEMHVIGFIIPGLIAIWLDRQGLVETIAAMVSASVVVRLLLVLVAGLEYGL